jgi:hypothetical protein
LFITAENDFSSLFHLQSFFSADFQKSILNIFSPVTSSDLRRKNLPLKSHFDRKAKDNVFGGMGNVTKLMGNKVAAVFKRG